MIQRHSSRRSRLDQTVLNERLSGAVSYDRIAGYFRSSLFEVAGEALEQVGGPIRVLCNSDLDPRDLATATAAQASLRRSWCEGNPENAPAVALPRYQALYDALVQKRLEVRVLPNNAFGLIHGKAGVIRRADGTATSFLGSVNESASAWRVNYELLWEDDSAEGVAWVQEEFDALWNDSRAMDLACCPFIEQDLERIIKRRVIEPLEWKARSTGEAAASAAVETPLYRRDQGLWPHQKYFANLALERHRLGGARLVLADQVGLGKTVQMAMAALLMALDDPDGGPILVLAPKPLLAQWQGELMELLNLPSARWSEGRWVDENEVEYPPEGIPGLGRCPRRIGLISQGMIVQARVEVWNTLLARRYTCVMVDEAHRARRKSVPKVDAGPDEINRPPEPNHLMKFLWKIAEKTKSMILATATPVQLHPVEAWDLLDILSRGNDGVLGGATRSGKWFTPSLCLEIATGERKVPATLEEGSWYVRDPLPSRHEGQEFMKIRDRLKAPDSKWQFVSEALEGLPSVFRNVMLKNLLEDYGDKHNPLLRCIVRRTRSYLESTINPITGDVFLPKVAVKLFGEEDGDGIVLNGYLHEAYQEAENLMRLMKNRVKGAGFFRTLLLRRLGSSIEAGRRTVQKLMGTDPAALELEEEDDFEEEDSPNKGDENHSGSDFKDFTEGERASLERILELLNLGGDKDPKLEAILGYLLGGASEGTEPWFRRGCILFSQYHDTVRWVGQQLSTMTEFEGMDLGLYAGSNRSGFWRAGIWQRCERDEIKARVRSGDLKILLGTDAASEGLNLQRLGSLINIDLPWNPTRLEQRKGRIQRIGQAHKEIWIANLRYKDSVEDRVHQVLADRLLAIHGIFGQIPDTLEDVWVKIALHEENEAKKLIDRTSVTRNPFDEKYNRVEDENWDNCSQVLNAVSVRELLSRKW